jgi:hypothetical protein
MLVLVLELSLHLHACETAGAPTAAVATDPIVVFIVAVANDAIVCCLRLVGDPRPAARHVTITPTANPRFGLFLRRPGTSAQVPIAVVVVVSAAYYFELFVQLVFVSVLYRGTDLEGAVTTTERAVSMWEKKGGANATFFAWPTKEEFIRNRARKEDPTPSTHLLLSLPLHPR